ncbi:MAG: hypothetical protein GX998_06930 [Firmicutes bacterium]|nr:hypothetical protein [Bacillota bacterium]
MMERLVNQLDTGYQKMMGSYEQMLILAKSIGESLEAGQWEVVDAQLSRKQAIMQSIDAQEAKLARIREKLRQELGLERFSVSVVAERVPVTSLSNTIAELMDLIEKLQECEKNNEAILRKLVVGVQNQLEDFSKSKRVAEAYLSGPPAHEARFIDEKK